MGVTLRAMVAAVTTFGVVACAGSVAVDSTPTSAAPRADVVEFTTEDGITLNGLLFGEGDTAVVLGHMRGSSKEAWTDVAVALAKNDVMAFAFDFRGYAGQEGKRDSHVVEDMAAAIEAVRERGAKKVIVAGASMGATAAAAVAGEQEVDGVIAVSPPIEFDGAKPMEVAEGITEPALFIAAIDDQPYASDASALAKATDGRYVEYPGRAHGTDLFKEHGAAPTALVIRFAKNPAAEEAAGQ